MPCTATVSLRDHLDDDVLLEVAAMMPGSPLKREPGFVEEGPEPEEHLSDEELLFLDGDLLRCGGRGFFSYDEEERRSRRIDLRGPTDFDPGPLPMEGAADEAPGEVVELELEPERS